MPVVFADFDFEASLAFVCEINYDATNSVIGLKFDDLNHPPGGTQYVAWLANTAENNFINLGVVSSDRFLAADYFRTLDTSVSLEQFDRIILSAELDGGSPDGPSDIILDGVIDPATFAVQTELLSSNVRPGLEQYALAVQHSGLSADSLAQGNLAEARRHAEHVVNILEGEAGPNFGDLDNDGQAQNPGNGVGVFGYLLGARDLLTDAEPINPSSPIFFVQNGIDSSIANSNVYADEAVNLALKMFAVDTADEGLNIVDDLQASVAAGINGVDLDQNNFIDPLAGEGGLQTVETLAIEWIEGSYFPNHLLNPNGDQIGRVRLATVNDAPLSGIALDLYPVPAVADPSTGYFVYLISNEGEQVANLGQVVPDNFRIDETIPAGDIFIAKFDEVVIAIEPLGDGAGPAEPTTVVYSASFGVEQQTSLFKVVQSDDGETPLLASTVFESDLANQHVDFMIAALEAGDLPLARRHAEHVNNILVGEADERFGDVDGNGTVENPSESGVGAMVFHNQMEAELLNYAAEPESLNARSRFYGTTVIPTTLFNQASQYEEVLGLIGKLLSTDTVGEAGPFASQGSNEMVSILTGKDFDGNGVVDAKEGEGGIVDFEFLLHLLTDRSFNAVDQQ